MSRPALNRQVHGGSIGRIDGSRPGGRFGGGHVDAVPRPALVAIDARVPEADAIVAALTVPARIVRIDLERDGLAQIVAAAEAAPGRRLAVVCHGRPGALALGDAPLTAATLVRRRVELVALGRALAGAPIELYACAVAEGAAGREFVAALQRATGCPVAAAGGPVGGTELGGSWVLDAGRPAPAPALGAAALAALPVLLADVIWNAGTGDWNTAGNWNPAGVPGSGSIAIIENGGTAQLTGAAPSASVIRVAEFNGGSGTLQVTGGGTLTAVLLQMGVNAGSSGTMLVDGAGSAVRFAGSSFPHLVGNSGTASLTISNGATATFETQALRLANSNTGSGTLTVSGGGKVIAETAIFLGTGGGGTGTLNIGSGGAAGIVSAPSIRGFGGNATVSFNHTDIGYVLSSDGTGGGTAVAITDAAAVNQTGAGTTILIATNTYTGGTTIGAGTLQVGNGGTAGSIAGNVTNNATLAFSRSDALTFSGVVSGTGSLTKAGAGTLTLSGTNTYAGTTTVSAGTLSVAADGNLGGGAVNLSGGSLAVTGATTIDNAITGTGGLTKTGAGVLVLSGSNTYTGTTTISAGTVRLAGGNAIADGATVEVAAGATLDLNGTTETIGALTGAGTVTVGAGAISFSNPGANSFSGTLSGTGTFSVASGATLKGTGTYSTPVSVLSGATIAPGNSPGTISTGNLTLAGGSTATMEIDGTTAGTQYDQIAVTGTVTINSATLTTVFGYTSATGDSYVLISNDGADAVTGTFSGLAEGATFTSGGRTYRISYAGNDGNDVTLTDTGAVPTPDAGGSVVSGPYHLLGGAGGETFLGSDGDDTISAMAGDDQVYAGAGADLAYGNQGSDSLWGNADADTMFGGQDADLAYGNQGGDVLYGNLGDDTLYGGQDADTQFGGQGSDLLYGNLGDDRLFGNLGADTLYGGQGADTLSGGAGDDLLVGGLGADRYAFGSGDGVDTIGGFSAADGDLIAVAADVNGTGIATAADLLARLTADANGDAVLDLGSGNTVTLLGVPPASAAADWFLVA